MRVALASYRSKPHSGGQGVYVRHLSRALAGLGHDVEVFSGPPYPELDAGVRLTPVPSLDLYRPDDPFRRPRLREFHDRIDALEYAIMCTGGFPEPRTFSLRLARLLRGRITGFDVLQLRSNSVVRWEFRPGSTLFAVWTHGRDGYDPSFRSRSWGSEYGDLFALHPANTFLLKLSYWIN